MNAKTPQVSVVIAAYNQAQYLADAIESVLAQTFRDFEIILVDDGSTDETPLIAQQFNSAVRYVRQQNQGLASARNTGIRAARGEYIALLDSDDEWLPGFLETMMSLTVQYPEAAVYYCGSQYMDADGHELPQIESRIVSPSDMYEVLLRANFINGCSVLMRRSVVIASGLFDPAFRRLQDRELWLRLAREGHTFVGSPAGLVRYRLHDSSLSTDVAEGQRAVLALVEKHFGADDGQCETWVEEKRRAYGGAYRYCALTSLLRESDWQACTTYLHRALRVDPTLAADFDLFYELALGAQPRGYRGFFEYLDLEQSAQNLLESLQAVFGTHPLSQELQIRRSEAYGYAYLALGLLTYGCRRMSQARRYILRALRFHPPLVRHPQVLPKLLKSLLGARLVDTLKRRRVAWRRGTP